MKYVMRNYQDVTINGQINVGSGYDGSYSGETINLKPNFLQFEHTDGLNYENIEKTILIILIIFFTFHYQVS
jgi:hypothetical protein